MGTTNADQFISQPDWWVGATWDDPDLTDTGAKDAAITRNAEGVYDVEIGNGGCDLGHREIHVDVDINALWSVVDTDNTHKRISFVDDAGAAIDPTRIMVTIRRLNA
jgi:hypothetical protein